MSTRPPSRNRVELVRQATYFECGLACLVMVTRAFGADVSLAGARKMCPPSARGMTLAGMHAVAKRLGLDPVPVSINLAALAELELPAVLHWGFSHYVVLDRLDAGVLTIFDPSHGRRRLTIDQAAPFITGVAIEFSADSKPHSFAGAVKPLRFLDLLSPKRPLARPLLLGAATSLCLELLLVLTPWIVARMLNASTAKASEPYRLALLAFAVLTALALTRLVRGGLVVHISGWTQKSIMATAFRRLLDKPAPFFEQRYSTYVVSRFEGTDRLRTVLSEDYLNASIDVVMLVVLLAAIGLISPLLMGLTAAAALLVGAIRFLSGISSRRLLDEVVHARSLERLHLMETIRSIRGLKQFGKTGARASSYGRRVDNSVSAQGNYAWHRTIFDAAATYVSDCAWVGLALYLVLWPSTGARSAAALLTLVFYTRMLMDRASLLSGKVAELTTLKVQLDQLADIVEEEEGGAASGSGQAPAFDGLSLCGVTFGYETGNPLIKNLDLEVGRSEFVAIAGPSGCGKTTILKLMAGLLTPESGSLRWSGVDASTLDPLSIQRSLAFVFQDDELLEGDLLGNVTLFESDPDVNRAWRACEAAGLGDEIRAMPMRLLTMVGERGSALSGGQRQRLLIARALYHEPELLILDEATSQLDIANERSIHRALRALGITVIMVSHRPEAVAAADRIFRVGDTQTPEEARAHA